MRPSSSEQSAIAAVVTFADLIAEGGWPDTTSNLHSMLHETDVWTVTLLAAIIVDRLGLPARGVLQGLAMNTALSVRHTRSSDGSTTRTRTTNTTKRRKIVDETSNQEQGLRAQAALVTFADGDTDLEFDPAQYFAISLRACTIGPIARI